MDSFARNALRLTLAGAGIAVLATSYVGQASADEPTDPSTDATDSADAADTAAPAASLVDVPTLPAPEYLLSPSSLDTFVLPTISDIDVPAL